jgi:hypothetical protein
MNSLASGTGWLGPVLRKASVRLATISGAICVVLLAASTQVWEYPFPRMVLLQGVWGTFLSAITAVFAELFIATDVHYPEANPAENTSLWVTTVAVLVSIGFLLVGLNSAVKLGYCATANSYPICSQTAAKWTTADYAEARRLKRSGVSEVMQAIR